MQTIAEHSGYNARPPAQSRFIPFAFLEDLGNADSRSSSQAAPTRIQSQRWQGVDDSRKRAAETGASATYTIVLSLRRMMLRLEAAGRTLVDGSLVPGAAIIIEPGEPTVWLFRGPYDVLLLSVPAILIAEFGRDPATGDRSAMSSRVSEAPDSTIYNLANVLAAERLSEDMTSVYADSIGLAIVARLLAAPPAPASGRSRVSPLPKWRLKRALEYVENNLSEPVSLAAMAASAGLTRMHFAAQFRAATGSSPHEYLLRRRIECARDLLAGTRTPVVEIALQVGFQTQAHFTTVFKRFAGHPPHAWRQMQRQAV